MQSNANTKPFGGEDLKIFDIIHSLENPRLRLGFFQTIHDIENFKIFSTNGFSIVSLLCILFSSIKFPPKILTRTYREFYDLF